jgi:hypothetical protein
MMPRATSGPDAWIGPARRAAAIKQASREALRAKSRLSRTGTRGTHMQSAPVEGPYHVAGAEALRARWSLKSIVPPQAGQRLKCSLRCICRREMALTPTSANPHRSCRRE